MTFDADAFLARLWALDERLVSRGFHPLSPWWRTQIERFVRALAAGQGQDAAAMVRRWVLRVGRRGGKSSALARLAVAWALWGPWSVPAGDIGTVAFISVSRDEAAARLRTITAILDVVGERYREQGEEVELTGKRPALFKVFACSAKTAVGFTGICVIADECARWESRDGAANPAREVIASVSPSLATQPFGWMALSSSPWGTDDFHAECFDQGDTATQITSFAATWTANPSISEQRTREIEPDPRIHSREYGAQPGATVSDALDAQDLAACFGRTSQWASTQPFVAIDASSLRGDTFAWATGHATVGEELIVTALGGWENDEQRRISMADIVADISARAKSIGASTVFGDQREEAALTAMFLTHGITLKSYAWSEPSKDLAMQHLRRLMRERRLMLPEHERLRRELSGMKARMLPSGRISYQTGGLDFASTLVTLAHAIVVGDYSSARSAIPRIWTPSGERDQFLRDNAFCDRDGVWRYRGGAPVRVESDHLGPPRPFERPRRGAWR